MRKTSRAGDQLAVFLLGQRLQAACSIHARADDRDHGGLGVTDVAHDERPHVDPDADAQGLTDLRHDLAVEAIEREVDVAGGGERLPASRASPASAPKMAISPSPGTCRSSVVAADGFAYLGEQAVENEDDVVGQARLADGGDPRVSRNRTARVRSTT